MDLQKSTKHFDWSELQTVLEVARGGSLSAAARALDLQHSTVFRRIAALERRLRLRLFDRTRGGYLVRAEAEPLIEAARTMEEAALVAERRALGGDERLTGELRLSTSEVLGSYLLPPLLKGFMQRYPGIQIDVGITNRSVDLTRREADLALRVTATPPLPLIARRLGSVGYAAFGTAGLLQRWRAARSLAELPWLGFDDGLSSIAQAIWLRAHPPQQPVQLRYGSLIALIHAAAAGLGVAALTRFAAAQQPSLIRLSENLGEIPIYLLTHPDVRGNARSRVFSQYLVEHAPALLENLSQTKRVRLLPG